MNTELYSNKYLGKTLMVSYFNDVAASPDWDR